MGPAEAIRDLAESPLAAAGLELWDVEIGPDVVRLLVDRPGGVDLDSLTTASAALSPLLDARPDLVPVATYQLEVSSPGVERPLRTPSQYRRYLGETVAVKTTEPVAGGRRLRGALVAADEECILVALDDKPAGTPAVRVPYSVISRATTVLAWGPAPKPDPRRPSRSASTRSPSTSPSSKDVTS